jgi:hypothetical protein
MLDQLFMDFILHVKTDPAASSLFMLHQKMGQVMMVVSI